MVGKEITLKNIWKKICKYVLMNAPDLLRVNREETPSEVKDLGKKVIPDRWSDLEVSD